MKKIKERSQSKTPKVLSDLKRAPKELVRQGKENLEEKIESNMDEASRPTGEPDNAQTYAMEKIKGMAEETKKTIQGATDTAGRKVSEKVKKRFRKSKGSVGSSESSGGSLQGSRTRNSASVHKTAGKNGNVLSGVKGKKTGKKTVKSLKKSVKSVGRTTKAAARSVKTARAATKTAVRTTQQTARIAIQAAKAAVRLAAQLARLAAKAVIAAVKAAIAAIKALVTAIAAGGWIVVLVIIIIIVIVALISSIAGIFTADEAVEGEPMKNAIVEINGGYRAEIDAQIEALSTTHEYVKVIYGGGMDGDSDIMNNWNEVLAIYVAKSLADDEDTITVTPEKVNVLKDIFYTMNQFSISSTTQTQTVTKKDEAGKEITEEIQVLMITVDVKSMGTDEAVSYYGFDEKQKKMIEDLLSPEFSPMFTELLGIDIYGGMTSGDMKDIISNLPHGQKGSAIVEEALKRLGDPYSQPKRGQGSYVDCSYLVWWAYQQVGISFPSTSVEQAKYCFDNGYAVGQSELLPGDLVFWSKTTCGCGRWNEIHHIGIYIGDNKVVEASSSKGRVVVSELWGLNGGKWQVFMYSRPYI